MSRSEPITTPAQEMSVATAMAPELAHSKIRSPLSTILPFRLTIQNWKKVLSSSRAGKMRLITLLGMKIIRK